MKTINVIALYFLIIAANLHSQEFKELFIISNPWSVQINKQNTRLIYGSSAMDNASSEVNIDTIQIKEFINNIKNKLKKKPANNRVKFKLFLETDKGRTLEGYLDPKDFDELIKFLLPDLVANISPDNCNERMAELLPKISEDPEVRKLIEKELRKKKVP